MTMMDGFIIICNTMNAEETNDSLSKHMKLGYITYVNSNDGTSNTKTFYSGSITQ